MEGLIDTVGRFFPKIQKEVVIIPPATFHFPYLSDPRYFNSPLRRKIAKLNLPKETQKATHQVAADLNIENPFSVTTLIPQGNDMHLLIPEIGIGAVALSQWKVRLFFDPQHPDILSSLKLKRSPQIAHELNHVKRFQLGFPSNNLLDALINEGLAVSYEEHWGDNLTTPWGHALTPEQLKNEWQRAQPELTKPDYNHAAWFYDKTGTHPRWTGYSLGLAIVNSYIDKHPKEKMVSLLAKPAATILAESGFDPTSAHLP